MYVIEIHVRIPSPPVQIYELGIAIMRRIISI